MKTTKTLGLVVIAALIGGLAGIGGYMAYEQLNAPEEITKGRPGFVLPDLDGEPQDVSQWDGKVLAINFWASWCPPCIREIPHFIALQEKYAEQGVQFVGIAVDRLEAAREFAADLEVNYPQLHGIQDAMEIGAEYGNPAGTLPYTVVIDRSGVIRSEFPFEVDKETMERALLDLL